MKTQPCFRTAGLAVGGVVLLVALAACNRDQQLPPAAALPPAPAQVGPTPVVLAPDDYVYYPAYEVYYSSLRHLYFYQDAGGWVWRPEPPHVPVSVLFASPSVPMDFHDSPSLHHEVVIRSYPRNWSPALRTRGRDDRRLDDR